MENENAPVQIGATAILVVQLHLEEPSPFVHHPAVVNNPAGIWRRDGLSNICQQCL